MRKTLKLVKTSKFRDIVYVNRSLIIPPVQEAAIGRIYD